MGQNDQPQAYDRAKRIVARFVGQFGAPEPYRKLAWYAAIPLVLTPELLNYLRNTFLRGEVPWVAEVDLLLSDICQPVGYELYAMDTEVRAYMLTEMRIQLGVERMQDVARLLIHYVRHQAQTNPLVADHQLQSQQWAAMVYLDEHRDQVVREIAEAFRNSAEGTTIDAAVYSPVVDRTEFARLSLLTQTLAPELGAYPELVQYARQISRILASSNDQNVRPTDHYLHEPISVLAIELPALQVLLPADQHVQSKDYTPSATPEGQQTAYEYDVFVSYTQADAQWVREWLLPRLHQVGLRVCIDFQDFVPGSLHLSNVERAFEASQRTLLILTPSWIRDEWPTIESLLVMASDLAGRRRKLVPLLLKPCQLPGRVAMLTYLDLTNARTREAELARLLHSLNKTQEEARITRDVFISYSPADRTWVQHELVPRLEAAGLSVIINDRDFELGVPELANMEQAFDESRRTVIVLTPAWIESVWLDFEGLLVGTNPAERRRKLLPIMLEPCNPPLRIVMLPSVNFTHLSTREVAFERLIRMLLEGIEEVHSTGGEWQYDVFIDYSHRDSSWVRQVLLPQLETAGLRVLVDIRDFEIGLPVLSNIEQAVRTSRYTLVVLTPSYLMNEWTVPGLLPKEFEAARQQFRILPILLERCELPARLANLNYADFTYSEGWSWQIERLVQRLYEAPDQPLGTYDVYISYSHHNREWVWNELLPQLDNAGLRVYIDIRMFRFGAPTIWNMEQGINNSRHVLFVMTPEWVQSQWAQQEVWLAQADQTQQRKVLPLLLEQCVIPSPVRHLQYLDLTNPETRDMGMTRLISQLGGNPRSSVRVLKVIVAAPSDVQAERDSIKDIVADLNRSVATMADLRIETMQWETDIFPGFHTSGPQALIDSAVKIEECDLLIGIFWKHFGTPVADAGSGTEYEFRVAYETWKKTGHPQIMVYFNQKPYMPRSAADLYQYRQVLQFKDHFPKEGLWWEYTGKAQFEKMVRNHLTHFIHQHEHTTSGPTSSNAFGADDSTERQPSAQYNVVDQKAPGILIDLVTFTEPNYDFTEPNYDEPAVARLDWTPYFSPQPPSPDIWQNMLLPELSRLRDQLKRGYTSPITIALRAKARLSAAYAFGYVFRATAGFRLHIQQRTIRNQTVWWGSDEPLVESALLQIKSVSMSTESTDISIEVSIGNLDVGVDAEVYIEQHQLSVRERLQISQLNGPQSVKDGAHALAIARQIRSSIIAVRNRAQTRTVHLFGAMPVALAVLLGAQLNACGPIQCYEFDVESRAYVLACYLS